MGIFDRFPYSSTHEMNLDFMLGKATEIAESLQEVQDGLSDIDAHKAQAEQAAQAAQASQAAASASAGQAAQHVTNAEDAADRAEAASTEAETAADRAETALGNMTDSETVCQEAAEEAQQYAQASQSHSNQAMLYKNDAETAKNNAAVSASQASISAGSAANSATDAASSANSANVSATNASLHASNAETSATNAATSETNAADAADRAEAASTEAETAAQNASTAADGAITSATSAETRINTLAASLPEDFTELNNEVTDLKSAVDQITVAHVSVNRFNIDDPLTKHYKLWQNGTLSNSGSSHYFVTCPIAVTEGDIVRRNATITSMQFGAYVNADGTPGDTPRAISTAENIWTATRSGYISINFSASSLQNAMVTINENMPEEFVPYYDYVSFGDGIHLGDTQIDDVRGYGSPISGKLIAYNGDSICESRINQGTANNGGAYAKIVADIVHGTYANRAISGGILASAPGDGGSTPNRCVVSDVANMADDADLICFEGGINDYWRDVPLGDYSESDYSGTLDTTTVCGALESIFRQATNKWVGKPIVFVIVHKIKSTVYAANSAGYTFAQEREKMIGICNKYAIPYYDAFAESGLNAYNDIQNTTFLTSNSTGTPDGCHPNEAAYRRYYVPQLIALFESLMPRLEE